MAVIVHHEHQSPKPFVVALREAIAGEGRNPTLPAPENVSGELAAYVNHGRWIVECPDGCRWAVVASAQAPFFFCGRCANAKNGGAWLRVVYPQDKATIEYQLLKRPREENRNWKPGERVSDLIRENAMAGAL